MDDKEFRKLRREDLIEIIYQYQRREQRLLQENQVLKSQLEDRRIRMEKTGSIAEASLALSGIFQAAQKAADLYIESVKLMSEERPSQQPLKKESCKSDKSAEISQPAPQKDKKIPNEEKKTLNAGLDDKKKTAEVAEAPAKSKDQKPAAAVPEKAEPLEEKQKKSLLAGRKIPMFRKTQQPETRNTVQPKSTAPNPEKEKTAQVSKQETAQVQKPAVQPSQKNNTEKKAEIKSAAVQTPANTKIPEVKPEIKSGAANAPKADPRKNNKTTVQPKAPAEKKAAAGGDTDEFIASLKEYLGM